MLINHIHFSLNNELSEIRRLSDAMEDMFRHAQMTPNVFFKCNLALDELITNTVSYGFPNGGCGTISVRLWISGEAISIELSDNGIAFDPLNAPPPDLDADLDDRPIGGLGLHFVRTFMDDVSYRHDGLQNVLTLKLQLNQPESEAAEI